MSEYLSPQVGDVVKKTFKRFWQRDTKAVAKIFYVGLGVVGYTAYYHEKDKKTFTKTYVVMLVDWCIRAENSFRTGEFEYIRKRGK